MGCQIGILRQDIACEAGGLEMRPERVGEGSLGQHYNSLSPAHQEAPGQHVLRRQGQPMESKASVVPVASRPRINPPKPAMLERDRQKGPPAEALSATPTDAFLLRPADASLIRR